ncbi:MAG TPA: alkaline phosphatase family protein [Bacillales bacterium]|nr:alkaline phosphatase family protein [Bacillales bacterium]
MTNHTKPNKAESANKITIPVHPKKRPTVFRATQPNHVVIVVEENHSSGQIIGNKHAPYINRLARQGARLTNFHAETHPSQPNYLYLFSGSNHGVTGDSCPHTFSAPNLASELIANHWTFAGYSEDLPSVGFKGCNNAPWWKAWTATYVRRHSPWVDFTNVPASANKPFKKFPSDFSRLPTVSFVIPNLNHDMHDGTINQADQWLKRNIGPYVKWARTHNSLLILTWDENDKSKGNKIPTLFVGPMVQQGTYNKRLNHLNVLRTLEDLYGLPYAARSAKVDSITEIWK